MLRQHITNDALPAEETGWGRMRVMDGLQDARFGFLASQSHWLHDCQHHRMLASSSNLSFNGIPPKSLA